MDERTQVLSNFTQWMSCHFYGGERYFQHNLIADPTDGAFKSRVQIFEWQVRIPNLDEMD